MFPDCVKVFNISECQEAMPNCVECSAYDICTACDGDFVVNAAGDGCTGKML